MRTDYIRLHKRAPNIFWPRRYTEKMQWRKLFDFNPAYPVLSDKLAVRHYIKARVGDAYHVPVLWIGEPADIPFDTLDPPYVIKSNHASGQTIFITGDEAIDRDAIRATAASWLTRPYGVDQEEPGYWKLPRHLFIERLLLTPAGARVAEFRLFLFHGKTVFTQTVWNDNGMLRNGAFYTRQWTRHAWYFKAQHNMHFVRPEHYDEMLRIAETLGADFDHLRVDFFDNGEGLWLGELTLYSWSGLGVFQPDEADFEMGRHWHLRAPSLRALATMLLRRSALSSAN